MLFQKFNFDEPHFCSMVCTKNAGSQKISQQFLSNTQSKMNTRIVPKQPPPNLLAP
jgi:hypothetical protein